MSTEQFVVLLGLIGVVIVTASLLSGLVDRTGLPQVAIFLLLGTALGPHGLGLVDFALDSTAIQVVASLALLLVLFSDAIDIDVGELRQHRRLAVLILGPGTLIPAALLAVAGVFLLGLPWPAAAILGGALASTDPVLLRHLLRHRAVAGASRIALRLESGMNDVVLLPVVVLSMLLLPRVTPIHPDRTIGSHIVGLFVLGPLLGAAVGWFGIQLLDRVRKRVGVRRDYESLYALGIALSAFAAAEAVGGSGFLAAFFAGLMVAVLDVELCDCFLDFGQATSEMFLLLAFVAFGASVIWTGLAVADLRTLAFAALALVIRTLVLLPVLSRTRMTLRDRRIVSVFGPRGLSSLLLVLLPVFAGVPEGPRLFAVTALVVLLSIVTHGALMAFYLRRWDNETGGGVVAPSGQRLDEHADAETSAIAPRVGQPAATQTPERITLEELARLRDRGEETVLVDARTERALGTDPRVAADAVRLSPDDALRDARALRLSQRATLVVFCA